MINDIKNLNRSFVRHLFDMGEMGMKLHDLLIALGMAAIILPYITKRDYETAYVLALSFVGGVIFTFGRLAE